LVFVLDTTQPPKFHNVYIELVFLRPVPLGQQRIRSHSGPTSHVYLPPVKLARVHIASTLLSAALFFDPSTSRVHIMDINRFKFWHTLPVVLEAIPLSDYVAFDLEMTGVVTGHARNKSPAHTQATAYRLAVEVATTFQMLQIDLTCLSYDDKQKGLYNYVNIL
jgi:hypothetical protein